MRKRRWPSTRHVIGYLSCLIFITFVLTFFGFFPNTVRDIEAHTASVIQANPGYAPALAYTVHVIGFSFSPGLVLAHLLGIIVSPVGLFALLFYFVLNLMLPVH